MKTDLSLYDNSWYRPGAALKRFAWYFTSLLFFQTYLFPFSSLKIFLLKVFGAKLGRAVIVKPNVRIKYPWHLEVDDYTWIGEGVWIDNLASVVIGRNVCLSQEAFLLTGNHNFRVPSFDLMVKPIVLEEGVWIGARAVVCPGVRCHSHSVLTVGSVANKNLAAYWVYQGNPAVPVKARVFDHMPPKTLPA